jgi:hypothetical protein
MCCLGAEFIPVVSVVVDEVGAFTESLIRDGVLEGHVLVWGVVLIMMDYEGGGVVVLWWCGFEGGEPI